MTPKTLMICGSVIAALGTALFLWCAFGDDYTRMMKSDDPADTSRYLQGTVLGFLGATIIAAGLTSIAIGWRKSFMQRVRESLPSSADETRTTPGPVPDIPGLQAVRTWYGEWPSFHDAEVKEIRLIPRGVSTICLLAYLLRNGTGNEPYLVPYKHAIVRFNMKGLTTIRMQGQGKWGLDDEILELILSKTDSGYRLVLSDIDGYDATIEAAEISVDVEPVPARPLEGQQTC